MAITPGSQYSTSIATTAILDADVLEAIDVTKPEFKELLVRLGYFINDIVLALNDKDTGIYPLQEYPCGKRLFPNPSYTTATSNSQTDRPVFRTTLNFGALPNTATKSVPHNITVNGNFVLTYLQAFATDPTNFHFLPIPFVDPNTLANGIEIYGDPTNINIITAANYSAYTICVVYIEYVQT
jgi:hypothetical protein